jgi:hypothetical protein
LYRYEGIYTAHYSLSRRFFYIILKPERFAKILNKALKQLLPV